MHLMQIEDKRVATLLEYDSGSYFTSHPTTEATESSSCRDNTGIVGGVKGVGLTLLAY